MDTNRLISGAGALLALMIWFVVFAQAFLDKTRVPSQGRADIGVRCLMVVAWMYSVFPSLLQIVQHGRVSLDVTGDATLTGFASAASRLLFVTLLAVAALVTYENRLREAGASPLWFTVYLLPWCGMIVLSLTTNTHMPFIVLAYPSIALALFVAAPAILALTTLGYLTVLTASISLVLALVTPFGLVRSAGFSNKAVLGNALLAGPYSHPNELGLALILGLPGLLAIRRTAHRRTGSSAVLLAILWSGSRASMGTAVLILGCEYGLRRTTPHARRMLTTAVLIAGVALVVYVPLHVSTMDAYAWRGQIWLASLTRWKASMWVGYGPDAYSRVATVGNDFGALAFHGHNMLVHFLLVGGAVMVALVTIFLIGLVRIALAHELAGVHTGVLVVVAFVFGSILELITDFRIPSGVGVIAWLTLGSVFFAPTRVDQPEPMAPRGEEVSTRPVGAIAS